MKNIKLLQYGYTLEDRATKVFFMLKEYIYIYMFNPSQSPLGFCQWTIHSYIASTQFLPNPIQYEFNTNQTPLSFCQWTIHSYIYIYKLLLYIYIYVESPCILALPFV